MIWSFLVSLIHRIHYSCMFGKYIKGKHLPQVDDGYLRWIGANIASERWRKARKYAVKFLLHRTNQQEAGGETDVKVLLSALKACSRTRNLERGKQVHAEVVECGHVSDIYLGNALLNMYSKCGSMVDARKVFDELKHPTVVSWNVLILGYAHNGQGQSALRLFSRMISEGPVPDSVTFLGAIKACTTIVVKGVSQWTECSVRGREIHNFAVENGCISNVYVQSTLVDMYAKCGNMVNAREVFDAMKYPDIVCWNALILGYADNGPGHTAINLFTRMRTEGPEPDSVTYRAALKACALVGALDFGRKIHSEIRDVDLVLLNYLVDFYAKCGSLVEARSVFDMHAGTRDTITWTALLAGFSSCGDNEAMFGLFEEMQDAGFQPNGVTLLCVLTCCSHAGLVEKGKECFDTMSTKYGVTPSLKHYTCMVDILGRANKLADAMALLHQIPCSPNVVTWTTILSACCKWKNVDIGKIAFRSLIDLDDRDATAYVLMGQLYGSKGMLQEQDMVMGLKRKLKAYKMPGEACWTNDTGDVHTFLVEDNNQHPQIDEMRNKWESMGQSSNFPSVEEVDNEEASLCGHNERLALVCALINTQPGKTIRIVKNQKMCNDCHTATARISNLECRSIICRDASRIHVFKDGKCSCGDLW